MATHPYLDSPGPIAIAHRGGTESAPENTLRAFEAAVAVGFDHLETDVHLSSDGVLVAFHDFVLDRVTDSRGAIADLPFAQISAARIAGTDSIPTLDELLESFPDICFNIDPKSDEAVVALAHALRRHDALRRVCVGAFSDRRLERLRTMLGDDLCTAAGPREITRLSAEARLSRRSRSTPAYRCLQVPTHYLGVEIVTPAFIDTAHRADCPVQVWTVDDRKEMHRLLDLGVDGIMTDLPSVLRDVLEERGVWRTEQG